MTPLPLLVFVISQQFFENNYQLLAALVSCCNLSEKEVRCLNLFFADSRAHRYEYK